MSKKVEIKIIDPNGIGVDYEYGKKYSVIPAFAKCNIKNGRAVAVLAPLKPIAKKFNKKAESKK